MSTAYLLTGGNLGNRSAYLAEARALIEAHCGRITSTSSVYETAAWGLQDQPSFYNQAIELSTEMLPEQLILELLTIEEKMGRKRSVKMGPRIIDLDILLFNDSIINSDLLTVPHPALPLRRFALLPLAEIAPALIHPVLQQTISELLAVCTDPLNVQKKSTDGN